MRYGVERIWSGGQSGADSGGLFAARILGIPTGGYAPRGWRTETGPAPWLADYGLVEDASADYMSRTDKNVRESDGTAIFGKRSRGSNRTEWVAEQAHKPLIWIGSEPTEVKRFRMWLMLKKIRTLNVAGNRESVTPGISTAVRDWLVQALK